MAEIGRGDPRWIVQERQDGANCNNWHWTEKNITPWAKDTFAAVVRQNNSLPVAGGSVTLKLKDFDGTCHVLNRKRKLVFYYELTITLKFSGTGKDGEKVRGKLTVTEVDQDEDDFNVDMSVQSGESAAAVLGDVKATAKGRLMKIMKDFNLAIRAYIDGGMGTRGAPNPFADDDFADLLEAESDDARADAGDSEMAEIGIPESMEIVVEVKKSQVGDPMGTLLDPESLELLEVRDGTAAVASDAKECVGWRLRRVNDEPVASMDQVLELAKAAANVRLAFYYDPAAESSGDFADKYLASQAYRPETPASCCRHNATVRQLVTSSLLTRGMSRLLAAAKPSSILTKASLNDTSAAVAVMPEHPLPISTFLWTVDRSVASSTDSAYRAKLLQESFAAASKQLSVLASLAENADFLGRCRALLRHVDNPQVFATSVPQKVVEEESVLAALVSDRLLRVLKDAECAPYVASSVFYAGLRTNLRSHPCEKKRAVARNIGHIAKGHMRHQQQQQQKQKQAA